MKYTENKNCLICNREIGPEYLDLNDQPLANSYHKGESLNYYPLRIRVCTNCWHSQLSISVNPEEMFEHYLYISDTSRTLTKYFEWVTDYILTMTNEHPNQVLEIACNSGLLLEMFQKRNLICCGVDPAKNIRPLSEKRNLEVFVEYWDDNFAQKLKADRGTFDLILAFHVLPHVKNPSEFVGACKTILSDSGSLFLQTSQCDMFLNNEFDVIYHEHTSYFTARSIRELAHRNNMWVSSIIKTDIHGKSFLFSLQKTPCEEIQLENLINEEKQCGIYTLRRYGLFGELAEQTKQTLLTGLQKMRDDGYIIVGYGAAAKGNTLLNYIQYKLDYIIDDNDMKWGYLTPGMNIPITSIDFLRSSRRNGYMGRPIDKICYVPLAWNFYDEIVERIKSVRDTKSDIFIRYFPNYEEKNI